MLSTLLGRATSIIGESPETVTVSCSKRMRLGGARDFEVAANILNLLNAGRGTEYARGGANRQYNTVAYLQPGNLQAARSFQLDLLFRF